MALTKIRTFLYRFFYSFRLVWKSNPLILFSMVLVAVIQGFVPVLSSLISKNVLNRLQEILIHQHTTESTLTFAESGLLFLILFLFGVRLLNRLADRLSNFTNRITGEQIVKTVKLMIMEKSKEIDMASYDTPDFYEKLENANREAGTRPVMILQNTFRVLSTVISFVSYLVILFTAIPWAALSVIVVAIPAGVINFIYRRKNVAYVRKNSKSRREMNYYAERAVNRDVAKEVRIFGLTDTFIESFKSSFTRYFKGLKSLIIRETLWQTLFMLLSITVNCSCYIYITSLVFHGIYQIGDFTLYTAAIMTIANEINTLINTSATIYEGTLFIDNLITFLNETGTVRSPASDAVTPVKNTGHRIEFRDVSFAYPSCDKQVLSHIQLTIEKGDHVVLVGLNGAGKTTLIKLMTRLYDPTEGQILLDGIDIRQYKTEELYSLYGIIFQDFGRYAYTVGQNICFGDLNREATPENLAAAAHEANADEFIHHLTDGYDTPLTRAFQENGTELSGGQWQKLAIARAFFGMKDILILDEPTAALDPLAENEIYEEFAKLSEGKTTLFVSHRLSGAVTASKIIVMENGRVVEEGRHKDLMALRGQYYLLFTTQAEKYVTTEPET